MKPIWRAMPCALEENRPFRSFTISHGRYDHVREILSRQGLDADAEPIAALLETSEALHQQVQATPADSGREALATLWQSAAAMVTRLDAAGSDTPDEVLHQGWGCIANAVDRIAEAPDFALGANGLPSLSEIMSLLDRLSNSDWPKAQEG
jgi:hypothetical protein